MTSINADGRVLVGVLLAGAVALLAAMIANWIHPFVSVQLKISLAPGQLSPANLAFIPQTPPGMPATQSALKVAPSQQPPPGPAQTTPPAPINPPVKAPLVWATGGRGLITIRWKAVPGADHYEILRNTSADGQNSQSLGNANGQMQYEDRDVVLGSTYYYWVRSFNASGAGPFSEAASGMAVGEEPVAKPSVLGPPSQVAASAGTYRDKIRMAWAPVAKAESYQIWRQLTGASEPAALLVEIMGDTDYYDDFMAGNGVYQYWIRAKNAAGISDLSKAAQGWRLSLAAPTGLFVSDRTFPDRIYVDWEPVEGAIGYEVWRQRLAAFSPPVTESSGINETWIWRNAVAADDAKQMAFVTETAMEDTAVETNVAYVYLVRARDALGGASPFTPWQQGSMRPISSALKPPAWVTATAGDFPDRIRVTWSVLPGQQFEVLRSTSDNNGTCRCINWGTGGPYYDDLDIVPGQLYYYWIRTGDGGRALSLFSPSASGYSAPPESR